MIVFGMPLDISGQAFECLMQETSLRRQLCTTDSAESRSPRDIYLVGKFPVYYNASMPALSNL